MYVSVVWTRAVCPKRPQVRANVQRDEVSGCGEVPGVGADLDGECGAVAKVENHGLRSVHPAARLDLPVLYGHNRFADGLEDRLQFVLGIWWADYLGVFSATGVLTVHPCSFGFLRTTSTFRHRASYPCLAMSPVLGASSTLQAGGGDKVAAPACSLRCARYAASASRLVPPSAFAFPTLQVVVVLRLRLRLPLSDQLFAAVLVLRNGLTAHPLNVARGEFDRDAVCVLSSSKLDLPVRQSAACLFRGHSFAPSIHEGILPPTRPARAAPPFSIIWSILTARRRPRAAQHGSEVPSRFHFPGYVTTFNPSRNVAIPPNPPGGIIVT